MFSTIPVDLLDLLKKVKNGRLQLPDFQRDYVWNDEDVRSLIASVSKGFPIGALLTLETGGDIQFRPRLLAGVPSQNVDPDELLLDGQQRMTSLFQATFDKQPVRTRSARGTEVDRYYYFSMKRVIKAGANIENAIVGVPADRIVRRNFGKQIETDLSTREKEFSERMFPLNQVFDHDDWFYDFRDYWRDQRDDVSNLVRDFDRAVVDKIFRYKMPLIRLDQNNTREAICLVFEKVNVGGKKLDAFELLTAIYASSNFDLRHDWYGPADKSKKGRREKIIGGPNPCDVLTRVASTDFLQACTLLHTRDIRINHVRQGVEGRDLPQISCKRDALLALPLKGYEAHANAVTNGMIEAGVFLNEQKIIWHKDIPYPPMIVGLAAIFAILGPEAKTVPAKEKITRWYWSVTLGELLGSSTETRLARDVTELEDWIRGVSEDRPRALDEAVFQQERLLSLRIRNSAAYKGVHALLMRHGCRDFRTNRPVDIMTFFNDRIDIHHVFPQAWCKKQKPSIESATYNSIINKTPLSRDTNVFIGGDAPSEYLQRIEETDGISPADLDDILRSHLIDPIHLREDDFEGFLKSRMRAISRIIASAMGKPVVVEEETDELERDVEIEDDEVAELESSVWRLF